MAKRRKYRIEFKIDAAKLVEDQGYTIKEIAERPGIPEANLTRWLRQYRSRGTPVSLGIFTGEAICLEIKDEGPGLDTDQLERLGKTFYRPDSARQGEGSGLGLAIVKHIVTLHRARWQLDSAVNEGFSVKIWFPKA